MRVLFIFLVLVNVAYYWYSTVGSDLTASRVHKTRNAMVNNVEDLSVLGSSDQVEAKKLSKKNLTNNTDKTAQVTPKTRADSVIKPSQQAVCYSLGPFVSNVAAVSAENEIKSDATNTVLRTFSRKNVQSYWVYLPRYSSYELAKSVASSMRKKGYKEYYIVAVGDYKNAISLGLFKERDGAERRLDRVRQLGYPAKIETKFKTTTLYWVDYTTAMLGQENIKNIVKSMSGGSGNIQLITRVCDTNQ